jgi:hypothetical protein
VLGACLALGALRFAVVARRGLAALDFLALLFLALLFLALLLAGVFVRFTTLVDFGKAFLLKDRSPTVPKDVQRRQMFLACFVTPESGYVGAQR